MPPLAGSMAHHVLCTSRKSGLLIDSVDSKPCEPIIGEIDRALARHYGFTDKQLDFIPSSALRTGINYDIKYRLGQGGAEEAEEE